MKFTWDENKRLSNMKKHGIDLADVPAMFEGDVFTIEDTRFDYGETRYITCARKGCHPSDARERLLRPSLSSVADVL